MSAHILTCTDQLWTMVQYLTNLPRGIWHYKVDNHCLPRISTIKVLYSSCPTQTKLAITTICFTTMWLYFLWFTFEFAHTKLLRYRSMNRRKLIKECGREGVDGYLKIWFSRNCFAWSLYQKLRSGIWIWGMDLGEKTNERTRREYRSGHEENPRRHKSKTGDDDKKQSWSSKCVSSLEFMIAMIHE